MQTVPGDISKFIQDTAEGSAEQQEHSDPALPHWVQTALDD